MFAYLTCSDLVVANMLTVMRQIYLSNCHKKRRKKKLPVTITLHPYFVALYVSLNEVYSVTEKGKTKTSGITLTGTYLAYVSLSSHGIGIMVIPPSFRIIYILYAIQRIVPV